MRLVAMTISLMLALLSGVPAVSVPSTGARTVADLPASSPDAKGVTWSPDGRLLAYAGPEHQLMLLDLTKPDKPRQIAHGWAGYPIFRPDGEAIVYTGAGPPRQGGSGEWRPSTLFLQELDGGKPADLLPGDLAVQSVSTAKKAHRWLSGNVLAYEEHLGTSVQRLFFLDLTSGQLVKEPELLATWFRWAPAQERVVGQWSPGAGRFWVRDREAGYLRQPTESVEVFEAWSPDGRELLYTEWDCPTHYCNKGASTLWRLDLQTGRRQIVAKGVGLAAWSATGQIAYARLGDSLELVVTDAGTGRRLWSQKLGRRPEQFEHRWDMYRPQFEGGYLAFRNTQGDWFLSRAGTKDVRRIDRGEEGRLTWGPGGQHIAIRTGREKGRLRVLENPLAEDAAPAIARVADKVTFFKDGNLWRQSADDRPARRLTSFHGPGFALTMTQLPSGRPEITSRIIRPFFTK